MIKRITAMILIAFVAACSSTPEKEQQAATVEDRSPGAKPGDKPAQPPTGAEATPLKPGAVGANPLTDPASPLSKRSVFFDFDSFVVKDEYKPLVEAHARYLQSHPAARMTIQGNTDERGSREYNIALGQKRADSVKRMMTLLGAGEAQIETVSFGKEKPRNQGHDEAAWAENRRDDILYSGE